ncbi:hypothetical protein [Undibacterium oligocarboniphilum]|uniref:Uncharacterized protein n=1 Tax=Undibacterium oligocarboniphilum TaxID=666702 RepID=A0A850QBE9_9BURK|nr:hypothetical protein [Undibacterium oligocarboniphilum]MBC3868619.1 hypothetical protein [Undibacterium oligocarboniphilum]NVO76599.1 hypothetical protein [Undibacterium oligocarboniphilum]
MVPSSLYSIPTPTDPVFDSSVEKSGLVVTSIAEDATYVYEKIRSFRIGMLLLFHEYKSMDRAEFVARCQMARDNLLKASSRGELLIEKLRLRANQKPFWKFGMR